MSNIKKYLNISFIIVLILLLCFVFVQRKNNNELDVVDTQENYVDFDTAISNIKSGKLSSRSDKELKYVKNVHLTGEFNRLSYRSIIVKCCTSNGDEYFFSVFVPQFIASKSEIEIADSLKQFSCGDKIEMCLDLIYNPSDCTPVQNASYDFDNIISIEHDHDLKDDILYIKYSDKNKIYEYKEFLKDFSNCIFENWIKAQEIFSRCKVKVKAKAQYVDLSAGKIIKIKYKILEDIFESDIPYYSNFIRDSIIKHNLTNKEITIYNETAMNDYLRDKDVTSNDIKHNKKLFSTEELLFSFDIKKIGNVYSIVLPCDVRTDYEIFGEDLKYQTQNEDEIEMSKFAIDKNIFFENNNVKTMELMQLKNDMEEDAINLLNNFNYKTKYFADDVNELWQRCAKTKHRYDITSSIDEYINIIDKCYRVKKFNENFYDTNNMKYNHKRADYKNYNYCIAYHFDDKLCEYIMENISEKQLGEYEPDRFRNDLTNWLKNVFEYEDDRWIYEGNENKRIDLQYGVYIDFTPDQREKRNDIEKYLKINLKCPLEDLKCEKNVSTYYIPFDLIYIDKDYKEHTECLSLPVLKLKDIKENNKYTYSYKLSIAISNFISTSSGLKSQLTFGQYDFDTDAGLNETADVDSSTDLIDTKVRIIEKFKKYSEQPVIIVEYMKDNSINAYFRVYLPYEESRGTIKECKKRKLPYKENLSIDEILELYLSDENQVGADENFLLGNESIYEYETEIFD